MIKIKMLRLKSEFNNVFANKDNAFNFEDKYLGLIILNNENNFNQKLKNYNKLGIICSKKIDKRAVIRNRIRRIIKESIKQALICNNIINKTIVLLPKKMIVDLKNYEINNKINTFLKNYNLNFLF